MIELILPSIEGAVVFDVAEGDQLSLFLLATGFSYDEVPIVISFITYSDYMDRGFNLTDEFDADEVPANAADGVLKSQLCQY